MPSGFTSTTEPDNLLEQLGKKYQPTKRMHNYLQHYSLHFQGIRHSVRNVLEIGVDSGQSLHMWAEYFPNARIHGIDIREECRVHESERCRVHIGDASDPRYLDSLLAQVSEGFDIVIDDGSHEMRHQLVAFEYLFPRLTSHGIYVVEDTGACVGDAGQRVIQQLAGLIPHINYWPDSMPCPWPPPASEPAQNWLSHFPTSGHWACRHITGISFYRWIVFVQRGLNPEDNPFFLGHAV